MKIRLGFATTLAVTFLAAASSAHANSIQFFQGFETDNSGWDVFGGALNATRVPSGTGGVTSATGGFHGQAGAAATNWGGYNATFPALGYLTSLDIYLDVSAGAANDTRFDFTSAINNAAGNHLRDFAFNGGFYNDSDATGSGNRFVFSASNNTGRANSFPKNPGRDPFAITTSGWYTFEHEFYNLGGFLAVDLSIYDASSSLLHSWTLTTTDLITGVGGNRYGWLANNEFGTLAIDNSYRANIDAAAVPEPASMLLLGTGLAGLAARYRRSRAKKTVG